MRLRCPSSLGDGQEAENVSCYNVLGRDVAEAMEAAKNFMKKRQYVTSAERKLTLD